jgi:hypothetical protein
MATTEYGIPEQIERPFVCDIADSSITVYWFTPNPDTFGSACDTFEVQCKGNGEDYEEMPTKTITFAEALGTL